MQIPQDLQSEAGHSAYHVEKAHPNILGVKILKNPSPLENTSQHAFETVCIWSPVLTEALICFLLEPRKLQNIQLQFIVHQSSYMEHH